MSSIGPRSSTPYNGHVSQKIDPLGQRKVLGVNGLAPRETSGRSFEQRPTKACLTDRLIGGLDEREKSFNKQFSLASRIYWHDLSEFDEIRGIRGSSAACKDLICILRFTDKMLLYFIAMICQLSVNLELTHSPWVATKHFSIILLHDAITSFP